MGRPITATIEATAAPLLHGGRLEAARRRFAAAPVPFIDLSTGINPRCYKVPRLDSACFSRLPDPCSVERLQRVAAQRYGAADPAMLVAAPGTQIVIALLARLFGGRSVAVLGPTYGEHEAAWARAGSVVTRIGRLDEVADQTVVVVCNPNNPDGRVHQPAALLALADRLAVRGGLLVVDEAFADFTPRISLIPVLPHPAIIVLRSFGKSYGLAGVRLGFAVAAPALAARIGAALGPWAVSGPAITIGSAALGDAVWLADAGRRLARDAARLDRMLTRVGFAAVGGTCLFRLVEHPSASDWFERLGQAGILVRPFDYAPGWLRFGIPGAPAAWARLGAVMGES